MAELEQAFLRKEAVLSSQIEGTQATLVDLLIILLLEHWGLLSSPLLYLSLFFKRHRAEYYRRLDQVRREGDWEGWTAFFIEAVDVVATEAVETVRPTATKAVDSLVRVGVLEETSGRKRDRLFRYGAYLEVLESGQSVQVS